MRNMTHSYVWCDWFIYLQHDSAISESSSSNWNPTHLYAWHYSFVWVTWLIRAGMTHSYMWHDTFVRVIWRISKCQMTHVYMTWLIRMCGYDSFFCATWLIRGHDSFVRLIWLNRMCDVTHSHVWHHAFGYVAILIFCSQIQFIARGKNWDREVYGYQMRCHVCHMGWVLGMWYPMWHLYAHRDIWVLGYHNQIFHMAQKIYTFFLWSSLDNTKKIEKRTQHNWNIFRTWLIELKWRLLLLLLVKK